MFDVSSHLQFCKTLSEEITHTFHTVKDSFFRAFHPVIVDEVKRVPADSIYVQPERPPKIERPTTDTLGNSAAPSSGDPSLNPAVFGIQVIEEYDIVKVHHLFDFGGSR